MSQTTFFEPSKHPFSLKKNRNTTISQSITGKRKYWDNNRSGNLLVYPWTYVRHRNECHGVKSSTAQNIKIPTKTDPNSNSNRHDDYQTTGGLHQRARRFSGVVYSPVIFCLAASYIFISCIVFDLIVSVLEHSFPALPSCWSRAQYKMNEHIKNIILNGVLIILFSNVALFRTNQIAQHAAARPTV